MTVIHAFMVGCFFLILVYLGVKNKDGVVAIFNSGGTQTNNIIKSLQGR